MKKIWHDEAWEDYLTLQNDKKLLKKANALLKDIERGGYDGIGKPEPLKGNRSVRNTLSRLKKNLAHSLKF